MLLDISIVSPVKVIFEGKARSIILPGEQGVFEVLPFHKPILSRLITGTIVIDDHPFSVLRGVVKVYQNKVTVVLEEAL
jgi:F-type H+-transporting ATPase subunit epsilon